MCTEAGSHSDDSFLLRSRIVCVEAGSELEYGSLLQSSDVCMESPSDCRSVRSAESQCVQEMMCFQADCLSPIKSCRVQGTNAGNTLSLYTHQNTLFSFRKAVFVDSHVIFYRAQMRRSPGLRRHTGTCGAFCGYWCLLTDIFLCSYFGGHGILCQEVMPFDDHVIVSRARMRGGPDLREYTARHH